MAESFRCVVAIPTRELYSGDVYYADVPGCEGHYGVLHGHESLVSLNAKGDVLTLWLDEAGNERKTFLVHMGCSQVLNNHLSVVGRFGCATDDINVEEVKAKADRLSAEIEEKKAQVGDGEHDEQETVWITTNERRLEWYNAQIEFAQKGQASAQ